MTARPGFLDLPPRAGKPRQLGLTHVLDKAAPLPLLAAHLGQCASVVDIVKIGWGLGYLDPQLAERADLCRRHDVVLSTGGTFLEIAAHQRRISEFRDWALATGLAAVAVSNGLGLLTRDAKLELIATLSRDFIVYAETGSKDRNAPVEAATWAREMRDDLAAGAAHVVAEGRESGTVGLYRHDGAIRAEFIDALAAQVDPAEIIFEAPQKAQQLWLIDHFGPDVNLGNVELSEVSSLETLRLGLRADTALRPVRATTT